MKNNFKRCLALLMALMMIVGAFSIPVSAAEECDHDYEKIVKAPTCTTVGYTTYICKLCNDSYIDGDIQGKLEHNYVKATVGKVPTCTTPGYSANAMVCKNCEDVLDGIGALPIEPANHKFDESKTYPDGPKCGEAQPGEVVNVMKWCIYCSEANKDNATEGFIIAETTEARVEHKIVTTITKEVKCGSNGEVVKACEYCDYVVDITIIKTPHVIDNDKFVITNSSVVWYKQDGTKETTKFSSNTKAINGTNGDAAGSTVPGTDGKHVKVWYCQLCGEVAKAEEADHTYKVPADKGLGACNNPGKYEAECKDCKDVTSVKVTEAHLKLGDPKTTVKSEHTADKVVVGYKVYECQRCGEDITEYDDVEYTNDAHNPAKWSSDSSKNKTTLKLEMTTGGYYVAPTCTDVGYGKYVCEYEIKTGVKCEFYKVAEIKALGHDYTGAIAETGSKTSCVEGYKKVQKCTRCDSTKTLEETKPLALGSKGHEKVERKDLSKKPTCFEDGYKAYGCATCGEHKNLRVTQNRLEDHESNWTYWDNGETGCFKTKTSYTKCSKCTADLKTDVVKVVNEIFNSHKYTANDVGGKELEAATCSTTGKWGYACERTCIGSTPVSDPSKAEVKCTGMEVTKTIEFDKNNHLGGKPDSLSNGKTYDYTKNGTPVSLELKPNYLINITDAKVDVVPAYSCVELQYTWWYCESCDKEFEKVAEYPVVAEYDVTAVDPTKTVYYAGSNQHVWETKYDLDGDGNVDDGLKEPTCTDTGIGMNVCAVPGCGAKDKVTVAAKGHKKPTSGWTVVEPLTCISYGVKKAACANGCGAVLEDKVGTTLDKHSYDKSGANPTYTITLYPTCTAAGSKYTVCTVDGCSATKTVTNGDMAKLKHDQYYENKVLKDNFATRKNLGVAATCTTAGKEAHYKCGICKTLYKVTDASNETQSTSDVGKTIKALGHTDERTNGTLTPGVQNPAPTHPCSGYTYTPNYCSEPGCGVERTWTNFKLAEPHTAETEVKGGKTVDKVYTSEAKCYEYAYTYYKCTVCGADFGHEPDKTVARPHHVNKDGYPLIGDCRIILGDEACTACFGTGTTGWDEANEEWIKCTACASAAYYECDQKNCTAFIPAHHEYVNEATHSECNAKVSECKFCGKTHSEKITETLPYSHNYVVTVEPTITTEGTEVCSVCGYENEEKLPRLPAVTFSMNAYNPNGGNIVNGGLVYVKVNMKTLEAIEVNNIRVAIKFKQSDLIFSGVVDSKSVFGNLSSEPEANDKDGTVYVFDDAGKERYNITLDGEMTFVTLAFYVKPTAYDDKDRLVSELEFTAKFTDEKLKDYEPSVSYYDSEKETYSDYSFDITTNDKIDLSIDQLGDVDNNGKVNNYDLVAVRDAMAEGAEYDAVLDIDHDGEITIKDYKFIKEYMVAKYYYWQFADLDSYNEYLGTKDSKANDETAYMKWLDPSYTVKA